MANIERKLGTNIYTFMHNVNISLENFAENLGYSIKDVWNIIEGKIIVPPVEIERISKFMGTTKNDLLNNEPDNLTSDLQYIKEFSNPNNFDKILDLIDEYVELREVV